MRIFLKFIQWLHEFLTYILKNSRNMPRKGKFYFIHNLIDNLRHKRLISSEYRWKTGLAADAIKDI